MLIGTWRSDKTRTLESWPRSSGTEKSISPSLEDCFGKLAVKYTKKLCHTSFEGNNTRGRYRAVWENDTSVFVVFENPSRETGMLITFDGPNVFWVHSGRSIEFFSRQTQAQQSLQPDGFASAPLWQICGLS